MTAEPRAPLSLMDVLAAAVAVLASVALVLLRPVLAPTVVALYEDLDATLPTLTRVALEPWPGPVLALAVVALTVLGLLHADLLRRRLLLAGSALGSWACVAALWYAMYLPLTMLSGAIHAE